MKLEQSFEVHAPIDTVWAALNDLERVAPCLPGAAITGHDDDGTYHGEFKVKLGPTTAAYKGTIKIENADEATHTATLAAKGTDKRGQGGANATIVNTLHEIDGGTRVDAVTDFAITGRLARFGRGGMIQDISNKLLRDFATCLATRLGEEAPSAPSGAEVTSGEAAPEAVAAAAPYPGTTPDAEAAAASTATAAPMPPPATAAAGGPPRQVASPPPAHEPLKAGSLFWSVMWERIKRLFGGGKKP
jgi:carbon monoxide dehydrogenase subunit G